ncbi:MAG TPA: UDP-N-acetylmuramoyl-L-alanyl-D-glutamate--2,6-diaminopimelate ligase, partial [Polyangiaceae bacterium]|nr:UDP-N-acetylmuramoyl-L-alanyl-D-glutamate--2,6-diaminopimelate ligase [Polyangiaceae bacterium]
DSRRVHSGSLFVARRGDAFDGRLYAQAALDKGAACVLCQASESVAAEPRIEVPDLREAWGVLSHKIYGEPCRALCVVGITGTNGKTTVASLVAQALQHLGKRTARAGTLGFFVDNEKVSDSLTTPMPDQLARMLAQAVERGAEYAILEVSSHALNQKRTAGMEFCVTAFTNLTQDHLDYHGTLAAYAAEKERLFSEYPSQSQVFNLDDATGRTWYARYRAQRTTTGVSTTAQPQARIFAENAQFGADGIVAAVHEDGSRHLMRSPLLGRHNLENLLVAFAILRHIGLPAALACDALQNARGVAGRLERCEDSTDDIVVVVDYAHTPDALRRVLSTLQALSFAELVCVFGCGGDRDRSKRPLMGQAVAEAADRVFVTSDNPRTEHPDAIIADILPGLLSARSPAQVDVDRRSSIERAVLSTKPGGCVLIAGKGHEDYQIIGKQVFPFDDRAEAKRALAMRREQKKP